MRPRFVLMVIRFLVLMVGGSILSSDGGIFVVVPLSLRSNPPVRSEDRVVGMSEFETNYA